MGLGLDAIGALNPVGAIGTAISGAADIGGMFLQHDWNERDIANAEGFSERMSSTAYQRGVDDLRRAGLNPILAAGGGGDSSPQGTTLPAPNMGSVGDSLVSSAQGLGQLGLNYKTTMQGIDESNSRIAANNAQSVNSLAQADKAKTGWAGDVLGSDPATWLENLIKSGWHSAQSIGRSMDSDFLGTLRRVRSKFQDLNSDGVDNANSWFGTK